MNKQKESSSKIKDIKKQKDIRNIIFWVFPHLLWLLCKKKKLYSQNFEGEMGKDK